MVRNEQVRMFVRREGIVLSLKIIRVGGAGRQTKKVNMQYTLIGIHRDGEGIPF
jgi:hypothetical protein